MLHVTNRTLNVGHVQPAHTPVPRPLRRNERHKCHELSTAEQGAGYLDWDARIRASVVAVEGQRVFVPFENVHSNGCNLETIADIDGDRRTQLHLLPDEVGAKVDGSTGPDRSGKQSFT